MILAFARVQCQEAGGVRTRRSSAQSEAGTESSEGKDRRSQFPQTAPDEGPCSDLAGHSGIYLPLPVSGCRLICYKLLTVCVGSHWRRYYSRMAIGASGKTRP